VEGDGFIVDLHAEHEVVSPDGSASAGLMP
jgi:hypothetical protein